MRVSQSDSAWELQCPPASTSFTNSSKDRTPFPSKSAPALAQGCVINQSGISYISWDLITPVIRLITFRADNISARALGKLPIIGRLA